MLLTNFPCYTCDCDWKDADHLCLCWPMLVSRGTKDSVFWDSMSWTVYSIKQRLMEIVCNLRAGRKLLSIQWILSLFCSTFWNSKKYLSVQTKNWDTWLEWELVNASIFASRDSLARAAWNGKTCKWLPFLSKRCNAFSTLLHVSICKIQRISYYKSRNFGKIGIFLFVSFFSLVKNKTILIENGNRIRILSILKKEK